MLPGLRESLGDSHAVLTIRFCQQVFGVDFSHMERHERVKALKSFGVDTSYLGKDKYTEELVKDRLQRFCNLYQRFSDQCAKVVRDSGMIVS